MRIVIGRAESGKTSLILSELAAKAQAGEGRQILLVPELFSHAYERRLAEATRNHGGRTAEVLTFSRLAGRVFAEAGGLADVAAPRPPAAADTDRKPRAAWTRDLVCTAACPASLRW